MASNEGNTDESPPQPAATDHQRELATQAMHEFERGQYNQCTNTMGKLADSRPTDIKVVLNRAVALFYQSNCKSVDEFRHNLHTVFNMARISPDLSEKNNLDDADYAVVYYNKAVVQYHEKQYREALSVLEKLFKYIEPIDESLAQKVMLLLTELYLTVHQPYDALRMVSNIEKFLSGKNQSSQDKEKPDTNTAAAQEILKSKLVLLKVRCNLMAKQLQNRKDFKTLQGNSPPVSYVKAYHEFLRKNYKKSSKLLGNSPVAQLTPSTGECLAVMHANNLAVLNMAFNKPNLSICQIKEALRHNEKVMKDAVPNEKAKPTLALSYVGQHYVLYYNLGVLQLHCRRPTAAFDCFVECVQVYHRNPRLWLRIAECCIMNHKEDNDSDRERKHMMEVIQNQIGAGFHHKLVLGQGHNKGHKPTSGGVFPTLCLGFAAFCLKNALALLPTDPLDITPPSQDEQAEAGPPPSDPVLVSAEPGNPLRESEVANLRVSILSASAYVALCENDYYKALSYANNLLRQPNLSSAQRYIGSMYKSEALVAMDRITDAIDELNPDKVQDISTTLPEPNNSEKDPEAFVMARESLVKWAPSQLNQAKGMMYYNLAVAYAARTEYEKALDTLTHSSNYVGHPIPIQLYYLKIYLDLKLGNKTEAFNVINDNFGYMSRT